MRALARYEKLRYGSLQRVLFWNMFTNLRPVKFVRTRKLLAISNFATPSPMSPMLSTPIVAISFDFDLAIEML